jgi:hypothetical protein
MMHQKHPDVGDEEIEVTMEGPAESIGGSCMHLEDE